MSESKSVLVLYHGEKKTETVKMKTKKFSIGHLKTNDLSIPNKCISGCHCYVQSDESDGYHLTDISSNGILLNGIKMTQSKPVKLKHGDHFHLIKNDALPIEEISLKFYENFHEVEEEEPASKVLKLNEIIKAQDESVSESLKVVETVSVPESLEVLESESVSDSLEVAETVPLDIIETLTEETPNEETPTIDTTTSSSETADAIEESLLCSICQGILHDCISLLPCLHSFCAGCYSSWMAKSSTCPECRQKVKRITRNHLVNNMIDAFLKTNPQKRRPTDELEDLDKQNKITKDMLYPSGKKNTLADAILIDGDDNIDDESASYTSSEDSDSDVSADDNLFVVRQTGGVSVTMGMRAAQAMQNNQRSDKCRECPVSSASKTSGSATNNNFVCDDNQAHVLCNCCTQLMPNRQLENNSNLPPIQCVLCSRYYCYLYWGCKPSCNDGCLKKLSDWNFVYTNHLLLANTVESDILKDHVTSVLGLGNNFGNGWKEFKRLIFSNLDMGMYSYPFNFSNAVASVAVQSSSPVCKECGEKVFGDLALQFRRDLPHSELPAHVTARQDCYWGSNCRTQKCIPTHARKLNHICSQTRFKK